MGYLGEEAWYWIDAYGNEYLLGTDDTKTRFIREYGGVDMPEPVHITERSPGYHGTVHRGWHYNERTITLGITLRPGSRAGLWDAMGSLRQVLNLVRGKGKLKAIIPTAAPAATYTRYIDCRVNAPFNAGSDNQPNTQSQNAVLQFTASWPLFYDPTEQVSRKAFNGSTLQSLVVDNAGEEYAWPRYVIYPPANYAQVRLAGSPSDYMLLRYDITAATGPVTIYVVPIAKDDAYGKRAIGAYGEDLTYLVSKESRWFGIPPGRQTLQIAATYGGTGRVDVFWHNEYLGLGG